MRLAPLLLLLALSGCLKQIAIRPDQLPTLSGMGSPQTLAQSGNVSIIGVPTATVVTPEGFNVEIRSPYNAIIETESDAPLEFEHPVTSNLTLTTLTVAGGNRAATDFRLNHVRSVAVTQVDMPATMLLTVGLTLGGSLLLAGVMVAALSSH